MPTTFVVDYNENYDDVEGVGTFTLVVRQKKDKIGTITVKRQLRSLSNSSTDIRIISIDPLLNSFYMDLCLYL